MDITIQPVNNGWLVNNITLHKLRVFIDREAMMDYLDEIIPPTDEEPVFLDNVSDENSEDDDDWDDDDL